MPMLPDCMPHCAAVQVGNGRYFIRPGPGGVILFVTFYLIIRKEPQLFEDFIRADVL